MSYSFADWLEEQEENGFLDYMKDHHWSGEDVMANYYRCAIASADTGAERARLQEAFDVACPATAARRERREAEIAANPDSYAARLRRRADAMRSEQALERA